jgi:hypothetical protein
VPAHQVRVQVRVRLLGGRARRRGGLGPLDRCAFTESGAAA